MSHSQSLIGIQPKSSYFDKVIKIEWFIGLMCNFSCSYCAEYARSGFASKDQIFHGFNLLKEKYKDRTPLILLGGGEPSIHPNIFEIAKESRRLGFNLSMISNGSRPAQDYVELMNYMDGITFSLHFEQKFKKTMESITAISRLTKSDEKKYIQVNVMMAAGHFNEAKQSIQYLTENEIPFIIRRIRPLIDKETQHPILPNKASGRITSSIQTNKSDTGQDDWGYYNSEEVAFLKSLVYKSAKQNTEEIWLNDNNTIDKRYSNSNEISLQKLNKFKDWICNIGLERLHIYNNGDVYRNTCKVGGKLGNIYEDFTLPEDPVVCTRDVCTCAWAINVSKAKNQSAQQHLRFRY